MSLCSSEAILLDVYDLHEYDQIVTMLARDAGKRRAVAKGSRRRFSRYAGRLRLLDTVRATWFEKESRDLVRLSSLETIRSADALTAELEGILLSSYLAESVSEFAQETEESDLLYRLLESTVSAVLDGVDQRLAARFFEAWILRLMGVFPEPAECPTCGRDLATAAAVLASGDDAILCRDCASGGTPVSAAAVAFLHRIGRRRLRDLSADPPTAQVLAECEEVSGRVRRAFLQNELKSYRVMRETLAGLPDRATR